MVRPNLTPHFPRPGCARHERGQDLVEFAIVLPILLLLTLGIMEFGILIFSYNTISNAAREGARYGIVHPAEEGPASCVPAPAANSIIDAACNLTVGLDRTQVTVESSLGSSSGPLGNVTVSTSYTATLITAPIWRALGEPPYLILSTSATMDREQ